MLPQAFTSVVGSVDVVPNQKPPLPTLTVQHRFRPLNSCPIVISRISQISRLTAYRLASTNATGSILCGSNYGLVRLAKLAVPKEYPVRRLVSVSSLPKEPSEPRYGRDSLRLWSAGRKSHACRTVPRDHPFPTHAPRPTP